MGAKCTKRRDSSHACQFGHRHWLMRSKISFGVLFRLQHRSASPSARCSKQLILDCEHISFESFLPLVHA